MEQEVKEVQLDEGISIVNIFRLLLSHFKILILSLLIGAVLGSSFSVWRTYDVHYYGSSVGFYINPEKSSSSSGESSQYGVYGAYGRHVMDNMIKLLSSESFFEQMMLNGEELPGQKDDNGKDWYTAAEDQKYGISAKIIAAQDILLELKKANATLDAATAERTKISTEITKLNTNLSELTVKIKKLWSEAYEGYNEAYYGSVNPFQNALYNENRYLSILDEISNEGKYGSLYSTLIETHDSIEDVEDNISVQKELLGAQTEVVTRSSAQKKAVQAQANEKIEPALIAWRKTANYQSTLSKYKGSISFSYLASDEDEKDANNLARSFVYVTISVLNDKAFAGNLLQKVKEFVPEYVKENMTIPSGYSGTNCQRTTRTDDIALTNPGYTLSEAAKYGILAAAIAFILTCVAIILLDRSDKRLRDTDVITKQFNVPLLGIIPAIEAIKAEDELAKKTGRSYDAEVKQ